MRCVVGHEATNSVPVVTVGGVPPVVAVTDSFIANSGEKTVPVFQALVLMSVLIFKVWCTHLPH